MGGAGGMRVDGGWDSVAGGGWGEWGGWVIQSDVLNCFRCFFLYHPKNRPSLSEPSDSLP